jgi:hypothetical protein
VIANKQYDLGRLEAMRELCLAEAGFLRRPQRDEERLNGYFNLGGIWKYQRIKGIVPRKIKRG